MRNFLFALWRSAVLPAFLLSLLFLPSAAFAVVGDVTLTGLPPNETVSLTNEETKERVEQKTDERGFVIIPLTGKNWQSGRHSVTCQVDDKPVTSKIFLRDGANRVDLTSLTYSARPLDPAKAQKVDEALKKSTDALKADPKNSQALLTQGAALNRLGRHGEVLFKLAQAAKMGSTHPALAFETGWSLLRVGLWSQAIAHLEEYEKMRPGLGQTSEFIGRSHLFMGELDKADAKFTEALQRDPKLASTVRFHQAILETLRKNPEAASKHISALLKEAPNSPMAQIFKNALLQAPGTKPPPGAGAKDFALSDPMKITLPPTTAADVAGAVAKGLAGTLLGGLFGGRRRDEDDRPDGPKLTPKPNYPEWTFATKDGKTKVNLSGAMRDGKPNIVMGVKESPGNGAPHLIMLQDKNCNVMQPTQMSVTNIWEQWGGWKLTVSWTKSYYQDGRLVKQEKGGWSTPWNIFRTQINDPGEIPGIWKDFGGKPFEGIREVLSTFEPAPGVPFIPADWNLITHATTDAGNNQILTTPFVTGLGTDQNNNLIFKPMDRTACESAPPTAPLLANVTTFPWTVGPFGIGISGDQPVNVCPDCPPTRGPASAEERGFGVFFVARLPLGPVSTWWQAWYMTDEIGPDSPGTVTLPGGTRFEPRRDRPQTMSRPDPDTFPKIEFLPDGTTIETYPSGTRFEIPLGGIPIETRPDGTRIETRADGSKITTFPDGSSVEVRGRDGRLTYKDPPPSAPPTEAPPAVEPDVPGREDNYNAPPVDQVM